MSKPGPARSTDFGVTCSGALARRLWPEQALAAIRGGRDDHIHRHVAATAVATLVVVPHDQPAFLLPIDRGAFRDR